MLLCKLSQLISGQLSIHFERNTRVTINRIIHVCYKQRNVYHAHVYIGMRKFLSTYVCMNVFKANWKLIVEYRNWISYSYDIYIFVSGKIIHRVLLIRKVGQRRRERERELSLSSESTCASSVKWPRKTKETYSDSLSLSLGPLLISFRETRHLLQNPFERRCSSTFIIQIVIS